MVVGCPGQRLHLREHIEEGWWMTVDGAEVGAQGQGVDKEADERLKLRVVAVGNR